MTIALRSSLYYSVQSSHQMANKLGSAFTALSSEPRRLIDISYHFLIFRLHVHILFNFNCFIYRHLIKGQLLCRWQSFVVLNMLLGSSLASFGCSGVGWISPSFIVIPSPLAVELSLPLWWLMSSPSIFMPTLLYAMNGGLATINANDLQRSEFVMFSWIRWQKTQYLTWFLSNRDNSNKESLILCIRERRNPSGDWKRHHKRRTGVRVWEVEVRFFCDVAGKDGCREGHIQ